MAKSGGCAIIFQSVHTLFGYWHTILLLQNAGLFADLEFVHIYVADANSLQVVGISYRKPSHFNFSQLAQDLFKNQVTAGHGVLDSTEQKLQTITLAVIPDSPSSVHVVERARP